MIKNIEIFLANKLISCDTIVPLIMSMQKINKNFKVNYYIYHYKSYVDIKKNELLYHALDQTGILHFRGSSVAKNKFYKIILKFKEVFFIFELLIKLLLGKIQIIHFGIFSKYPFKLITYFYSNAIYHMERVCILKHENVIILDNLNRKRNSGKKMLISSKNILYFNENFFRDYNCSNANKVLMKNPRTYRTWYEYIMGYGVKKVRCELRDLQYDYDNGYFLYIIGYIGYLDYLYKIFFVYKGRI